MFEGLLLYPTLGFNLLRNYLQPVKWAWYNRIDDSIVLGALPFRSMLKELIEKENIGAVICCTQEYEMQAVWKAMDEKEWRKGGIEFYALPMTDFIGTTSRSSIDKAVKFVDEIAQRGKSVAMFVTCYLMRKNNWYPNVAFEFIKVKRPQVVLGNAQWRTVNEYQRYLDHKTGFA
ncbi:dual specificity phosphatase, catalytic domain protein [Onchocerca flexuosa]|uniref:Dual specificity phosphatase, catalytic domain protein n=1 Tax=Onchocerca flexuosa TaxID=387005 RepID=A0A238C3P6_9BILA|nr:dual specificity phosphatase, catalytic domain protein [Onchocerca flexuosa]